MTVAPILLIGVLAYFKSYQNLTELTLAGRQSVAELAAAVLDERFDRLTDLGTSLATREGVRQSVSQGKWDEAIEFLKGVRNENPMIERIFLSDPSGTLMADTPALPGVRGKNFSSRDWYRGVSNRWKPYVSDVYQRAAAPQYNVIAVAIPIKAEKEKAVGILVLQLRVEALVDWSKSVAVGASGFVFFVDKKGHLAAHPKIPLERGVVDYSSVPVVQKVLRGKSGAEINFNARDNEERVAAYAPVPGIGWGVVIEEPARTAFAKRDEDLKQTLFLYGFIFLIGCVLAYVVFRAVAGIKQAEGTTAIAQKELADVKAAFDEHSIVAITDQRGKITAVNDKFCTISKYSREELIGQDHRIINSGYHSKEFIRDLWTTIGRGRVWKGELKNRAKDGEFYWVDTTIVPFLNTEGKPYQYVAIRTDITERKRVEENIWQLNENLQQKAAQLEAANKELEAFSYSVSHDLRAPLRSIDGFSQALLEDYADKLDQEGREHLHRVRASSQRMGKLIDDLLNLSRVARRELRLETVNLSELAKNIAAELQRSQPERQVAFASAEGLQAKADGGLIRVVLENLLGNAWKFTGKRADARIEFGVVQDNGSPAYFLRDDGAGFDMAYANKLFGAFQRLHGTAEFPGTGIGLATVQRIIHRHGGKVWAEGKINEGATFYFALKPANLEATVTTNYQPGAIGSALSARAAGGATEDVTHSIVHNPKSNH